MANQAEDTLRRLETRVRQLILHDKALRDEIASLKGQLAEREQQAHRLATERDDIAQHYSNLKVARMLELSDTDTRSARLRLNHLIREVDKCIALLKS